MDRKPWNADPLTKIETKKPMSTQNNATDKQVITEELLITVLYALDATRIQLALTARLMSEQPIVQTAFQHVIHACEFQADVAKSVLLRAKEAGYGV